MIRPKSDQQQTKAYQINVPLVVKGLSYHKSMSLPRPVFYLRFMTDKCRKLFRKIFSFLVSDLEAFLDYFYLLSRVESYYSFELILSLSLARWLTLCITRLRSSPPGDEDNPKHEVGWFNFKSAHRFVKKWGCAYQPTTQTNKQIVLHIRLC